ncbi:hypothetical protein E2C01_070528 [Portunus trituberculatus]|uniref:Uncharacterized protein n=1 Tax=Portunus trituberculatus TaxID=210409 RepID=A0A5B7I1J5_PORTR|nr:hypothetical protein [Portunus trituberculatus]
MTGVGGSGTGRHWGVESGARYQAGGGSRARGSEANGLAGVRYSLSQSPARHRRGRVTPDTLRQQQVNGCRRQPALETRERVTDHHHANSRPAHPPAHQPAPAPTCRRGELTQNYQTFRQTFEEVVEVVFW